MAAHKEYVQHFNHLAMTLLTERDRDDLHKALRNYQRTSDISKLAKTVNRILNTTEKQKMLAYIRAPMTIPEKDKFDRLIVGDNASTSSLMLTMSNRPSFLGRITTPPGSSSSAERHVTIYGSRGGSMGFSIRGGSEFGLGIYVSHVRPNTPAAEADLRVGDHILNTNGVDLTCVANSSAVKVLSSSALLNLRVVRTGKVPEWKVARERVLWYDVALCRVVATPPISDVSSASGISSNRGALVERKLVISVSQDSDFIGLNIRGGKEYGVGIYVSRVDTGGLASKVGLAPGDQIVSVNGTEFYLINHSDAVDVLRSSTHLIITIKSVGKYPVYKELFAEYTWSDGSSHSTKNVEQIGQNTGGAVSKRHTQRTRARESSIDLSPYPVNNNSNNSHGLHNTGFEDPDAIEELDDGLAVQSVLCYPEDKDIMFRRHHEDSWKQLDNGNETAAGQSGHAGNDTWYVDNEDSLGHFQDHEDSDLSEHNVDYTTFLEHNRIREEKRKRELAQRKSTSNSEHVNNNGEPVIETVIEEGVTNFSSNRRTSAEIRSIHSSSDIFMNSPGPENDIAPSQVYAQFPGSPALDRKDPTPRSSDSSSINSQPIYATVNKKSGSSSSSRSGSLKSRRAPEPPIALYTIDNPDSSNGIINGTDDDTDYESELKRLQARQSHLGSWELSRVAGVDSLPSSPDPSSNGDNSPGQKNKTGTWRSSLKKKLKESLRLKGQKKRSSLPSDEAYHGHSNASTPSGSIRQKGIFERSFGSQILNPYNQERYNLMGMLEDNARRLLSEDESKAVVRHIHNYHENKDINRLVELLLTILDKPEKRLLLVDVRGVIAPSHVDKYDSLVEQFNLTTYENKLSTSENLKKKSEPSPLKPGPQPMRARNGEWSGPSPEVIHEELGETQLAQHSNTNGEGVRYFTKDDFNETHEQLEVVILETEDLHLNQNRQDGDELVYISKHKNYLGLEISGGRNNTTDPAIRVARVVAGGAASDDRAIEVGKEITHVDGKSLIGLSRDEAESILQLSFSIKTPVNMELRLRPPQHHL